MAASRSSVGAPRTSLLTGLRARIIVSPLPFETPPTIDVPEGLTIEATGPYGSPLAYDVTAHDAEDGQVPVSCTPGQGGEHPLASRVSRTATDSEGLHDERLLHGQLHRHHCAGHARVDINAAPNGPDGTRMGWDTHLTDNADWYPDVACVPESFSDFVFPIGDKTVTCTATDDSGQQLERQLQRPRLVRGRVAPPGPGLPRRDRRRANPAS